MIRDGVANDWESICKEFGLHSGKFKGTRHHDLLRKLYELKDAGFIDFNTVPDRLSDIIGPIRITRGWESAQHALGVSLAQLAEIVADDTMVVQPYFGLPPQPITDLDVFVLVPFKPDLKPIYDDHIRPISQRLELAIARADDFFTAHSIMSDVWAGICAARVLIADCTGRNPNVSYEIGIAHVLGKDVVILTQNSDDVPFDLGHLRRIQYKYTPRGMVEFEEHLVETLKNGKLTVAGGITLDLHKHGCYGFLMVPLCDLFPTNVSSGPLSGIGEKRPFFKGRSSVHQASQVLT